MANRYVAKKRCRVQTGPSTFLDVNPGEVFPDTARTRPFLQPWIDSGYVVQVDDRYVGRRLVAGADLTAAQGLAVKLDAAGDVVLAGAGEFAEGILTNAPASGEAAAIAGPGSSAVAVAGAAVLQDAELTPDANGKLVTATPTDFVIGIAVNAAAAEDDPVTVNVAYPVAAT